MADPCPLCVNLCTDEYGQEYCSAAPDFDEDEMARFLSRDVAQCPFFEPGNEYSIVKKQN